MANSPYLTISAQWDYIVSILRAQQNVGTSGVPGSGTNTSGTLQKVLLVDRSIWPEFNSLPFVGVQLEQWKETPGTTTRRYDIWSRFQIIAAVEVQASGTTLIKLSDAMKTLSQIIDDGAGNGIVPILGASANFTLGNNAYKTLISSGRIDWAKNPAGKGAEYIAYALITLEAWMYTQRYP